MRRGIAARAGIISAVTLVLSAACTLSRDLDPYESGSSNGGGTSTGGSSTGGAPPGGGGGNTGGSAGGGGTAAGSGACPVPCTGSNDVCNPDTKTCVECVSNADCPSFNPICLNKTTCEDCATNDDCSSSTPHCDSSDHNCKQCLDSSHCPTTHSCHPTQEKCQPKCATEAECAGYVTTPHCKTSIGMCVECFSNTHCGSGEECNFDECSND